MSRTSPLTQPTHRHYPRGYQPLPPQKPVNAHPSNAIYAAGTGSGTGTAAKKIGYQNRDGTRSPVSALGGPTGPLSQPMPRMKSKPAVSPDELSAQKAQFAWEFNQRNPHLHMDSITGKVFEHPQAEARVKEWKAAGRTIGNGERIAPQGSSGAGNDIPLDGKGGYAKSESPLTTPSSSTAGQAQSMRESMAPNAGEDRYGRTSASPSAGGKPVASSSPLLSSSARGDWQQGSSGTRFMSDQYGAGSSKITTPADRAANAANAIGSTGGGMSGVVAAGVSAATTRPSAPILPGGVGAASTRSPTTPTSPQMVDKQPTPAYTPKPSAVPAEDLKRYADAYEKVKAQDAKTAAANAGGSPTATGNLNSRSMLADQTGGSGTMGGMKTPQATASSPLMTPSTRPQTPAMASTPPPATPQQPAASATSAPTPSAVPQPTGPSEQEIQAQANKAAASQRGYVGNAAVKVGTSAVTAAGNAVSAVNNAAAAVPKLADQMVEGAKKGFTQMGKDAFGTDAPTAATQKYGEMLDKETAARNAARGYNDAADLARYKAEDAASGTSPLLQSSSPPQGGSQMADAAAAEEEARRLKEQELASAE